jgi:hypothetical protein
VRRGADLAACPQQTIRLHIAEFAKHFVLLGNSYSGVPSWEMGR